MAGLTTIQSEAEAKAGINDAPIHPADKNETYIQFDFRAVQHMDFSRHVFVL